jgi:hypothetical protein
MPADDSSDTSSKPWVAHGSCTPEHEDFLIGNRAGLELLKRKVDDTLATGECRVDEGGVEFVGIRLVERDPRAETAVKPGGFKDAMRLWGCGLVGFVLIMVFLAGLLQIWSWMK